MSASWVAALEAVVARAGCLRAPAEEQTAEAVKEVEEVLLQHLQLIYAMCAAPSRAVAPFASPLAQTTHTSSPDLRLSLSLPPTTPSLRLACAASI